VNPPPVIHLFEVWFIPAAGASLRLSEPLRIGPPLADPDDAQDLAHVAAADLPAYGFPRGQVLIQADATVVQVLPTAHVPASRPAPSSSREGGAEACPAPSQREVALLALEDLRRQVSRARPTQAAPAAWIACLDQALRVIASPEDQRHFGLGRQPVVTVETLHQRLIEVLRQFGQPEEADAPPAPAQEGEPSSDR